MLIASGDVDARERLREKLPTSGLVIIDFAFDDWSKLHPQSGRLERFVSPKSLEAHGQLIRGIAPQLALNAPRENVS